MGNPMFKLKGPSMIDGKYPTAFSLKHQQKDMRLALALGDEVAQPMPVAAAANEVKRKLHLWVYDENLRTHCLFHLKNCCRSIVKTGGFHYP